MTSISNKGQHWTNYVLDVLHYFGFVCIPDKDRDIYPTRCPEPRQNGTTARTIPDNAKNHIDGRVRIMESLSDGATWDVWEGQERLSQLTDFDKAVIASRKLNEAKYSNYKVQWATKDKNDFRSAAKASTALTNKFGKGYGARTSETYYSAINEAMRFEYEASNPSPSRGNTK